MTVCITAVSYTHLQHFNPVRRTTASGNYGMVTDALRGKTVCTDTGGGTWSLSVQTVAVWWRGDVAYSCDSSVCIRCNFVHATDNNDLCRTENQSSHAVAVAVRVDKLAV